MKEPGSSRIVIEVDDSTTDEGEAMCQVSREKVEGDVDVWLGKYDPRTVEEEVRHGEHVEQWCEECSEDRILRGRGSGRKLLG